MYTYIYAYRSSALAQSLPSVAFVAESICTYTLIDQP